MKKKFTFFGIEKILPYMRHVRWPLFAMVFFA